MQIKDTSTRPRNLCWAISVAGALLFAVGVVIKNNGFSSVMTPTLVSALNVILLGILAGAFIAVGGVASTTASVSIAAASVGKLVGACVFPGGLAMVLLAGSELFTIVKNNSAGA